jgi:diphosphomevalonate decarboxylase
MAAVHPALVETCTAPSNIACIKYWGKDSVALNTPINSSVSVTLDQRDLRAVTTVCASKDFATDQYAPLFAPLLALATRSYGGAGGRG